MFWADECYRCASQIYKPICCVLNLIWLHLIFLYVTWSNLCFMKSADTRVDLWCGFLCEGWKLAREIADRMQMTWRAVSCGLSGEVITAIGLTLFNFQGHFYCIGCPLLHPDTRSLLFQPLQHPSSVSYCYEDFAQISFLWDCWKHYRVHFLSFPRSGGVTCSHDNLFIADCFRWNFGQKRSKVLIVLLQ